jgi:hypothetical protein
LLVRDPAIRSGACAYGDVVFCELVVEVVYADLASVAKTSQRSFALRIPRVSILVGCAPSRRSPVVRFIVFVTTTATSRAVFFVAIMHPVADSMSANVRCKSVPNALTHQCRIFRRVCSVSPEVGVSSCSSFVSAAAGRYRRLEWHGVMRRSWMMSQASEDCTVQGGGRCGTCRGLAIVVAMGSCLAMSLTFLTPSLGPSSLRGPRGAGGARLSGLRPPPLLPPPPRC